MASPRTPGPDGLPEDGSLSATTEERAANIGVVSYRKPPFAPLRGKERMMVRQAVGTKTQSTKLLCERNDGIVRVEFKESLKRPPSGAKVKPLSFAQVEDEYFRFPEKRFARDVAYLSDWNRYGSKA